MSSTPPLRVRPKPVVVLAALSAAVVSGAWLMGRGVQGQGPTTAAGSRLLDEVSRRVAREFVDSIPPERLQEQAAVGLVRELGDPSSALLTPERLRRLNESSADPGLGLRLDVRDGVLTVLRAAPGSPAERAGLRAGDRVVEIAGDQTRGLTAAEASARLGGGPGAPARFVVERPGVAGRIPLALARGPARARGVGRVALLPDRVGYVELAGVPASAAAELRRGVDSLRALGATSLLLDLRGAAGGALDRGVAVADLFLDRGQLVARTAGRPPEAERRYVDSLPQRYAGLPLAVLVDGATTGAAEVVAGALQDHDRAALVGATTYGEGGRQELFPTAGGGALKLTTARWYTPSGRAISGPPAPEEEAGEDDAPAAAKDSLARRPKFRTDAGRVVVGAGGIAPDVAAADTAAAAAEGAFVRALGTRVGAFRDAAAEYATSPAARALGARPGFAVTPAARDAVYRGVQARGAAVPRATYDAAGAYVDRQIGYEVARAALGPDAEFQRRAADDPALRAAARLVAGTRAPAQVLARAGEAARADSVARARASAAAAAADSAGR